MQIIILLIEKCKINKKLCNQAIIINNNIALFIKIKKQNILLINKEFNKIFVQNAQYNMLLIKIVSLQKLFKLNNKIIKFNKRFKNNKIKMKKINIILIIIALLNLFVVNKFYKFYWVNIRNS